MTDNGDTDGAPTLRRGAVAIIDALGFKGIWKTHEAAEVLGTLQSIKTFARTMHTVSTAVDPRITVKLAFFSDSVVIYALPAEGNIEANDSTLVFAVVGHAGSVIASGLEGDLHLTYRGCIALGEFAAVDEFLVGPAIDEAAEWANLANAAAVWLRPSAAEALVAGYSGEDVLLFDWSVPMKGREPVRTLVVNPLWYTVPSPMTVPGVIDRDDLSRRMLASFDLSKPEVAEKHVETERLLAAAANHTSRLWEAQQHEELPPGPLEYLLRKSKELGLK